MRLAMPTSTPSVYAQRALSLMDDASDVDGTNELRWRLLVVSEAARNIQGRRDEQRRDLNALSDMAEMIDDDRRRAFVALRLSNLALRTGDFRAQADAARVALRCADQAGDDERN